MKKYRFWDKKVWSDIRHKKPPNFFFRLFLKFLTEFRPNLKKMKNRENPENSFLPKESWYLSLIWRQNIWHDNSFIYSPFGEIYLEKIFADKRHIQKFLSKFGIFSKNFFSNRSPYVPDVCTYCKYFSATSGACRGVKHIPVWKSCD